MEHSEHRDSRRGEHRAPGSSTPGAGAGMDEGGAGAHPEVREEAPGTAGAGGGAMAGTADAGAFRHVGEMGSSAMTAGGKAVRAAIDATEDVSAGLVGGVAHVGADVVHGVTGLGYEIRNGATGLIGAVGEIGSVAIRTVAGLLVDVVVGVRQVVTAAVAGKRRDIAAEGRPGPGMGARQDPGAPLGEGAARPGEGTQP